jgi:hypothetical protein
MDIDDRIVMSDRHIIIFLVIVSPVFAFYRYQDNSALEKGKDTNCPLFHLSQGPLEQLKLHRGTYSSTFSDDAAT